MKKYRLTKIRIKTREIISMSNDSVSKNQTSVCPICHSSLAHVLPSGEKQTAELPPANLADYQDKK